MIEVTSKIFLIPSFLFLIFSICLSTVYIGCTCCMCTEESTSKRAPLWTSILGFLLASFGAGISIFRAENKWGLPYTVSCSIYVLICILCSSLTLVTYLSVTDESQTNIAPSSSTLYYNDTTNPQDVGPEDVPLWGRHHDSLWLVMMWLSICLAITAGIVSCVMVPTCVEYFSQRYTLYTTVT